MRDIEFVNTKQLSKEELSKYVLETPLSFNYFLLDIKALKERLKGHPWIKEVSIERSFPNRLQIFLSERKIAGVAALDQLMAVDASGVPIAPMSASEAQGLPILSGVSPDFFKEGGEDHIGHHLLARGLKIAKLYEESQLTRLRPLSEIYIAETGRIELMLNQTRVSLGKNNFKPSLNKLEKILLHLKRRGVDASYILLSEDQTRAIVREIPIKIDGLDANNTSP